METPIIHPVEFWLSVSIAYMFAVFCIVSIILYKLTKRKSNTGSTTSKKFSVSLVYLKCEQTDGTLVDIDVSLQACIVKAHSKEEALEKAIMYVEEKHKCCSSHELTNKSVMLLT